MDKISHLARQFETRHGLGNVFSASQIVNTANAVSSGEYTAISFRDGRLKIEVPAGPQLYLLRRRDGEVLERINKALKKDLVTQIVYRAV